ncbi:unnamed protein product [Urochloa humidicola]
MHRQFTTDKLLLASCVEYNRLLVWLKNVSLLSYLSVIVCLFWVGIGEAIEFHPSVAAINLIRLPVALGSYGYCHSGHSVFPSMYSSMKDRSQFPYLLLF